MAELTASPVLQFFDNNGNPLVGGKLYTYFAGTTSSQVTYSDASGSSANTNPIILDSRGECEMFLIAGRTYKFVLKTAADVTIWTVDNVKSLGDMASQTANNVAITGGTITGVTITGPINGDVSGSLTGSSVNVASVVAATVYAGDVQSTAYNGGQLAGMRNKIINGNMAIAQRGTSFTMTSGVGVTYYLDRWTRISNTGAVIALTQDTDVPAADSTLQYSLRCTVSTADAIVANTEYLSLLQKVEGYDARMLVGRTFTLSFWVRSSKVGAYGVSFYTGSYPVVYRSYVVEYSIDLPNTWEYKTITVPNGLITDGTTTPWTIGAGVTVGWSLYCGLNRQITPGSWSSTWGLSTSAQTNAVDTVGNIFALTGVQLEVGGSATPFEYRTFGTELALCQRYYEKSFPYATAPAQNTGATLGAAYATGQVVNQPFSTFVPFSVTKRTAPTITTYAPDAASANWSTNTTTPTAVTANIGDTGFAITGTTSVTAGNGYSIHWQANAEIT